MKTIKQSSHFLILCGITVTAIVSGCSGTPVVPPCPPCVVIPSPAPAAGEDEPSPACIEIKEPTYVYCSEPAIRSFDAGAATPEKYASLTPANISTPVCYNARMQPHASCVPPEVPYRRGNAICLSSRTDYDAANPLGGPGSGTKNRRSIWENYLASEACTSNRNCRANWNAFKGGSTSTQLVPGHDPQILLAPREVFQKLSRPHAYWCEPGPILASCPGGNWEAPNLDPEPVPPAESACSPGLAVIAGTFQAAGLVMSGGGATLGAISRGMNLDAGATVNAEQERQRAIGHDNNSSAATAVKKDGGTLGSSGAGASNLGSSNAATAAGNNGTVSPSGGINGLSTASSAETSSGGTGSNDNTDSGVAVAGDGKSKDIGTKVEGSGDYDSAAGGGGRGGQKSGSNFGGLGGGGSAPAVAGVSDVAFSKGGPGGPANPLAGLGGAMSDQEFERLLQKNSERSLFEIANRRYFQWGGSVMSGEAKDSMKKITP